MILNYSDEKIILGNKSLFLAGPTPRSNKIKSWRNEAIKILAENNYDGIVYIPEFKNGFVKSDYMDQVCWEKEALNNANLITFWIPRKIPKMPAFTTNIEFGYWIKSGKVLYGRPENAEKMKYLDWLYMNELNRKPITSLDALLKESISILENIK